MEEPTEINFYKCHGGGAANGGEGKCRGRERSWQGAGFLLLRTISYFTYEMANNQSEIAREGGFRERRTGCPLLPARSAGWHISISLVKSDRKLQRKIGSPAALSQPPHSP